MQGYHRLGVTFGCCFAVKSGLRYLTIQILFGGSDVFTKT